MKMTTEPPTAEGYYWWTNLGEHTPTMMCVTNHGRYLYASNGEYEFSIDKEPCIAIAEDAFEEPVLRIDGISYFYGTHFWAGPIDLPELGGKQIQPDYF